MIPMMALEQFEHGEKTQAYSTYCDDAIKDQGAKFKDDFMSFGEFCDESSVLLSRKSNQETE